MAYPRTISGTGEPRLRLGINTGNVQWLPRSSRVPTGPLPEVIAAVMRDGYEGFQGPDTAVYQAAGAAWMSYGRVDRVAEARELALRLRDGGCAAASIFVGTGLEDEPEALALYEAVLRAVEETGVPMFIETHRATLTQDIWRTVQAVKRLPDLRFSGDFSHWYTGLEMVHGDWEAKVAYAMPVIERTRFLQGRIGTSGQIQVDIGSYESALRNDDVKHFLQLWRLAMAAFRRDVKPGEHLWFIPELLGMAGYAMTWHRPDGYLEECGDRYEQASVLCRLAKEAWKTSAS